MGLTVETAPTVEPISVAEAKQHLRLEIPDDDVLVGSLITTARRYCENFTNRAFITQTWKLTLDDFPKNLGTVCCYELAYTACGCIQLPRPKLQSVSSVKYYDSAGTLQTMDSSLYLVDPTGEPGRVCLNPSQNDWPVTQADRINSVEITFVAGYGDADDVPQDLKAAMLLLISHYYENREAVVVGTIASTLPMAVESILRQYDWGAYR